MIDKELLIEFITSRIEELTEKLEDSKKEPDYSETDFLVQMRQGQIVKLTRALKELQDKE